MRRLIEATRGEAAELVEGVRVKLGDDWITMMPDPDRAAFHVVVESKTRERAREISDDYRETIARYRDGG
jgi:mannose-1-phosphate guanylyltransferase/phosphomannomutase